ncbi:hypothetical protein Dimus_035030 [Dionaea muscipula]
MAEAMLFNIAESLIKKLGSKATRRDCSGTGIRGPAREAHRQGQLDQGYAFRCLRRSKWRASSTKLMRKELRKESMPGCTLSEESAFAFKMARRVEKIRARLDDIEKETYSFVAADQVIGREEDKKAIVEMLMLDSTVGENISVVSIVAMGGDTNLSSGWRRLHHSIIEKVEVLKIFAICISDLVTKAALFTLMKLDPSLLPSNTSKHSANYEAYFSLICRNITSISDLLPVLQAAILAQETHNICRAVSDLSFTSPLLFQETHCMVFDSVDALLKGGNSTKLAHGLQVYLLISRDFNTLRAEFQAGKGKDVRAPIELHAGDLELMWLRFVTGLC